jgi:hypothetical protein
MCGNLSGWSRLERRQVCFALKVLGFKISIDRFQIGSPFTSKQYRKQYRYILRKTLGNNMNFNNLNIIEGHNIIQKEEKTRTVRKLNKKNT